MTGCHTSSTSLLHQNQPSDSFDAAVDALDLYTACPSTWGHHGLKCQQENSLFCDKHLLGHSWAVVLRPALVSKQFLYFFQLTGSVSSGVIASWVHDSFLFDCIIPWVSIRRLAEQKSKAHAGTPIFQKRCCWLLQHYQKSAGSDSRSPLCYIALLFSCIISTFGTWGY